MSNKDSSWKQSFKPKMKVNKIMQLQREHPDYMFAAVRTDADFDPNGLNLEQYLENGWEVVVDDCGIEDDYVNNTSHLKEKPTKPTPIVQRGRGKAQFVYVTKSRKDFIESEKKRMAKDKAALIASSEGRKITEKGGEMKITDPEAKIKKQD